MKYEVNWSAYGTVEVEAKDTEAAIEAASEKLRDVNLASPQDVDGWDFNIPGGND